MSKRLIGLFLVFFLFVSLVPAFAAAPKGHKPLKPVNGIRDDKVAKGSQVVVEKTVVKEVVIAGKSQIKNALLDMDIDDINQLQDRKMKLMNDSARDTGYVQGSNMGGAGGVYYFLPSNAVNDNKPTQVDNVTSMLGGAGGFLVNINPHWALGGLFGGASGGSSKKVGADFWSYSVGTMFGMLHSQFKPIITDDWIVGVDLGIGLALGSYSIYKTTESAVGQDTIRSGSTWAGLLGLDFRKRLTPTWHTGLKAGYFACKFSRLGRADYIDEGKSLDLSGAYLALCMGGNF